MTLFSLPQFNPLLCMTAFMTAVIEVPLFWLFGYRRWQYCLWFACVNIISNVLLNQSLEYFYDYECYPLFLFIGEVGVILLEYTLCCLQIRDGHKRLLCSIFVTNLVSFLLGIVFFSFIVS
ncbi:MAG: hypothetical protein IJU76_04165 [Desulfovibrionaceae bacterium]|nr:hypothetical protein [Desulfovibrionaceae bacterium]